MDNDGDLDLALTGTRADGMHLVLRRMLMTANMSSLQIRVLSADGRATTAGAEVRVYENRSRRLIAARIVDSGSGYNAIGATSESSCSAAIGGAES